MGREMDGPLAVCQLPCTFQRTGHDPNGGRTEDFGTGWPDMFIESMSLINSTKKKLELIEKSACLGWTDQVETSLLQKFRAFLFKR